MYKSIRQAKVTYPVPERHKIYVSPEAQDLINKLLIKNKDKRLGVNGVKEILEHEFFKDLDIEALLSKKIKPTYMPEIKNCEFFDQKLVTSNNVEMSLLTKE